MSQNAQQEASEPAQQADYLPLRMTRQELADFWRVTTRTLERHEMAGIGPRPLRVGGRVLYRRDDVLAWEERHRAARG